MFSSPRTSLPLVVSSPDPITETKKILKALDIQSQLAARLYADVNLAEYKALLANERRESNASKRANASAVAALAAYRVAVQALPFKQVSLDPLVGKLLEGLSDEEIKKAGEVANPIATKIAVAAAENSAAFEYANFKPASAKDGKPGSYAFTPGQKSSLYPQMANSKLYALQGGSAKEIVDRDFKGYSSLKVGTKEYESELAQVASVGWLNSTERTEDQSTIPGFWADGPGTPTVAGHYLQIAASLLPENASLLQTAELLSRVAVAISDASTLGWVLKYRDLAARPVTALRRGRNGAGNYSDPLPDWEPLLKTPPHPEYPSGHALTSGSAAEVLAHWFGRDGVAFSTRTAGKGFPEPRNFSSLRASAVEVGDSRVYGELELPLSLFFSFSRSLRSSFRNFRKKRQAKKKTYYEKIIEFSRKTQCRRYSLQSEQCRRQQNRRRGCEESRCGLQQDVWILRERVRQKRRE